MRWSKNLAYAIGLIVTDGNLSKDNRHINLTSKDYEQINNFTLALHLKNKISLKNSSYNPHGTYYFLQFGNVKLYRFLQQLNIQPNKSKSLNKLKIPKIYFRDFLRGVIDGDGYTNSYYDSRWKNSFMVYTGIVSASKPFLDWIRYQSKIIFDVTGQIKKSGQSTYHLVFAKRASLILWKSLYYNSSVLCLSRKKKKILNTLQQLTGCRGGEIW